MCFSNRGWKLLLLLRELACLETKIITEWSRGVRGRDKSRTLLGLNFNGAKILCMYITCECMCIHNWLSPLAIVNAEEKKEEGSYGRKVGQYLALPLLYTPSS